MIHTAYSWILNRVLMRKRPRSISGYVRIASGHPDMNEVTYAGSQMLRGGCIPKTAWANRLRGEGVDEFADGFLADDRGQDTVTLCFWVTSHDGVALPLVRQLYFSMRDGGNMYRRIDKTTSRELAEGWAEAAAATIEEGDHTRLLKPSSAHGDGR